MPDFNFQAPDTPSVDKEPEAPIPAMEKPQPGIKAPDPSADTQMYVAPTAPNLKIKIPLSKGGEVKLQFKKGQLEIPDEMVDDLDALLAKAENLRAIVRKVDLAAARAFVAEIEAKQTPAAASGTFTTAQAMQKQRLEEMNANLQAQGVKDSTYVKELGDMSMQMQEVIPHQPDAKIFDPNAKPKIE